jgi:hypothetical protein
MATTARAAPDGPAPRAAPELFLRLAVLLPVTSRGCQDAGALEALVARLRALRESLGDGPRVHEQARPCPAALRVTSLPLPQRTPLHGEPVCAGYPCRAAECTAGRPLSKAHGALVEAPSTACRCPPRRPQVCVTLGLDEHDSQLLVMESRLRAALAAGGLSVRTRVFTSAELRQAAEVSAGSSDSARWLPSARARTVHVHLTHIRHRVTAASLRTRALLPCSPVLRLRTSRRPRLPQAHGHSRTAEEGGPAPVCWMWSQLAVEAVVAQRATHGVLLGRAAAAGPPPVRARSSSCPLASLRPPGQVQTPPLPQQALSPLLCAHRR